jgi:hypothetical protein
MKKKEKLSAIRISESTVTSQIALWYILVFWLNPPTSSTPQALCYAPGTYVSYLGGYRGPGEEVMRKRKRRKEITCCKGNLTDLRRILHLSLAKGNPK